MTEFDVIQKAQHYNSHPSGVECIEIARYLTGDWFNAFKYVFRADHKNGREDLDKAAYYAKDALLHRIPIDQLPPDALIKLGQVIAAETDTNRVVFFRAIGLNRGPVAANSIDWMLNGTPRMPEASPIDISDDVSTRPPVECRNWEGTQHG